MNKLVSTAVCAATLLSVNANSAPSVIASQGTRASIEKTIVETWTMSDEEKKTHVTFGAPSQITGEAIAPSGRLKLKEWSWIYSQHRMCFYNGYQSPVSGRYSLTLRAFDHDTNVHDSVNLGGGQGVCITNYVKMLVKPMGAGETQTFALTHAELEGEQINNEGHGVITVR